MNFFSKVATKDSFEETIRWAPRVLHISCHGIRLKDRSSALLFENQYGAGDLVTEEQLTNLLKSSQKKIELIFLAACDSERVGKIFQKCGIPHVICVKQERFVLDEAAIDCKYAKSPAHAKRIKELPRREKEIFLHVEGRICGKKNPKFLHLLYSSNNAEETMEAFQLTPETYEEVVGEKFEPVRGMATVVAQSGRGTDSIEEAVSSAKSDSWVEGITYVFNQLQDFVYTSPEFRNIDWLRLEVADIDLVLGYFFLWLAPQQGSSALGKRYVPRTLKNIKTKLQNLLEFFLKRKDFNLRSAEAQFSKSMYEAKQNLTAKRAGGPGEGVQGDRERQAFTPADQKRIDAWILTKVNCLLINSGRLLVLKNTWI